MYQGRFHSGGQPEKKLYFGRYTTGTLVFYNIYFGIIILFIIGMLLGMIALHNWLVDFEKSQPTTKSQEVYNELFASPDWAELYTSTGQENTAFEGADQYASYMNGLVGNTQLTMVKTSMGLDKVREKYVLTLNNTILADFVLLNQAGEDAAMPDWTLESVNLVLTRKESVKIVSVPGHTVYVNGTALDDSYLISSTTTLAESYLPEGLHGHQSQTYLLTGLMTKPTVTITDASGNAVNVQYDAETNTYNDTTSIAQEMTEEIRQRTIEAAKLYARYTLISNEVSSKTSLEGYFDKTGETYTSLPAKWELWLQSNSGYQFSEPVVSEYYQYSDSLYSVRVSLTTTITRKDGTTKDYPMDTTYFVHLTDGGKWLVNKNTNEEIQKPITQVRLTYLVNGSTLRSEFVSSTASQLTLPTVEVAEGKKFLGWFTKEIDESGRTVMHLAFSPAEDGTVYLPEGTELEPMELYAQFESV